LSSLRITIGKINDELFIAFCKIFVAEERVFDIISAPIGRIIGARILRGFTEGRRSPKKFGVRQDQSKKRFQISLLHGLGAEWKTADFYLIRVRQMAGSVRLIVAKKNRTAEISRVLAI
jgi:hypothetical protein